MTSRSSKDDVDGKLKDRILYKKEINEGKSVPFICLIFQFKKLDFQT